MSTIDGLVRETTLKPWYLKHGLHRQRQTPAHAPREAGPGAHASASVIVRACVCQRVIMATVQVRPETRIYVYRYNT